MAMQFSIREVLLLTLTFGMAVAWWQERIKYKDSAEKLHTARGALRRAKEYTDQIEEILNRTPWQGSMTHPVIDWSQAGIVDDMPPDRRYGPRD